jgi:hypothetical protein
VSTSVVQNKVLDSSGAPLAGIPVRITLQTNNAGLNQPGVGASQSTTQPVIVTTDATGLWSTALTPNAEITEPTGTYYQVSEGGYLSNIVVPVGGGPYELSAGTPGWLRVSARVAGTSFTITSSSGTDTSTVAWLIAEPA